MHSSSTLYEITFPDGRTERDKSLGGLGGLDGVRAVDLGACTPLSVRCLDRIICPDYRMQVKSYDPNDLEGIQKCRRSAWRQG